MSQRTQRKWELKLHWAMGSICSIFRKKGIIECYSMYVGLEKVILTVYTEDQESVERCFRWPRKQCTEDQGHKRVLSDD